MSGARIGSRARSRHRDGVPIVDVDLYADAVLRDSRDAFARIREAGPVVWLPRHRMYAIGRFDDVKAALRNDEVFQSGHGVAANPLSNRLGRGTTLFSDGDTHRARRRVLMRSLGASALADLRDRFGEQARELVAGLLGRERFDAAADFASHLPLSIVADLVGIEHDAQAMLRWAAATFDILGPLNRRGLRATAASSGLLRYSRGLRPGSVRAGSWGASVFDARDSGEVTTAEAKALIIDYVAPALDTTILASTHLLWVLARHPDAWQQLRADPDLVPTAVVENVRLASPVRAFTRRLAIRWEGDGISLPAGARVAVLFGAANLDETRFPRPEQFDLHRDNGVHVGWGNGPHACAGTHLAKLEMQALLSAMIAEVRDIEIGAPQRLRNNTLQGIRALPASFRRHARLG
jgi:cytochrome P450